MFKMYYHHNQIMKL